MDKISKINLFNISILTILTFGMVLNFIPLIVYYLICLFYAYKLTKIEFSFVFLFFPGIMIIDTVNFFLVGNFGLLVFWFFGLFLIRNQIFTSFKEEKSMFVIFTSFCILYLLTYLYGPMGYYSWYKALSVTLNGFSFLCFFTVFIKSTKFNNSNLSMFLFILFLTMIKYGVSTGLLENANGVLDFGFIRMKGLGLINFEEIKFPDYHAFGMLMLFSLIFYLMKNPLRNFTFYIFLLLTIYLIFMTGARQIIFGLILILIVYFIKFSRNNFKQNITILILFVPLFVFLFSSDSDFVIDLLKSDDVVETAGGRKSGYEEAIKLFNESPIMGKGIGGFDVEQKGNFRDYPHNIFLEILSEGGLYLTIIVFVIFMMVLDKINYNFFEFTNNGSLYFLIMIGFFVRAISSKDLMENIAFISAFLAMMSFSKSKNNFKNEKRVHIF